MADVEESRDEFLRRQGWSRQFVASEPRLSEAVEMYREVGFDVHLEPLSQDQKTHGETQSASGDECRQCFEGFEDLYNVIYTRPGRQGPGLNEDLF
ncbi:MAG: hypothetical protein V1689_09030 [Pseudomonadota bacterium]